MILKQGKGVLISLLDNSAICSYKGNLLAQAPALQTAIDTPTIALAPRLYLPSVPSNSIIISSIFD